MQGSEVHGGAEDETEEREGVAYGANRTLPNPLAVVDWQVRNPHAIDMHGQRDGTGEAESFRKEREKAQSILLAKGP